VVDAIRSSSLQALACCSPAGVLLLTGYWPVMAASLAVVSRDGSVCAIVPEDELELALSTSDADFISYQPHSLDRLTSTSQALAGPVRQLAAGLRLSCGQIGIDLDGDVQATSYQSTNHLRTILAPLLSRAFPGFAIVSADCMLDRLESVKTPLELDSLRHASRLASVAFSEAEQAIAAGRREDEVAADIEAVFARVALDGFQRGRGYFYCMSGPNSAKAAGAYARTRRRVIQDGDPVMIHANTVGDGFWTDITRTFIVGAASDQQLRMRNAIMEARRAALDAIVPGAPARSVDAAARDVLAKNGFGNEFKHSTGHGVGFAAANPDAMPRIQPHSPDILEVGMTFNIEPAIYVDGVGGMRHCDVVACTGSGAEVLTDF